MSGERPSTPRERETPVDGVMAASKTAFWNIWLLCDDASAGAFADALGPFGLSVARFEEDSDVDFGGDTDPGPRLWRITALADKEPDRGRCAVPRHPITARGPMTRDDVDIIEKTTPFEGYYRIQGSVDYTIVRQVAFAPYADLCGPNCKAHSR